VVFALGDKPQQIHLALTGQRGQISVGWVTIDPTATSSVVYWEVGQQENNLTLEGQYYIYKLLDDYVSPYLHFTVLSNLTLGATYEYQCGSQGGWSDTYQFSTEGAKPISPANPVYIASIADHGTSPNSSQIVDSLLQYESDVTPFDFLYLAGDISYANGFQMFWDMYANMIQPVAAYTPWMVGAGNHEIVWGFEPYLYRYNMPQDLYWSINYENVHLISLNSEELTFWHWLDQYQWLQKDLSNVNRTETPWIIAGFHTPWYSSNDNHNQSGDDMRISYEEIFYQYGIDLVLQGHVHAYERTAPVYDYQSNENGPVYILNGLGGTEEGLHDNWEDPVPEWSVFRQATYFGFGVIEIHNRTHLHWKLVQANTLDVTDETWIVKDR